MDLSSEQSGGIDTVLATAIGIHRLAEAYVGGLVAADDAARGFGTDFRAQARGGEFFAGVRFPAVVDGLADGDLEAACEVRGGAAAFDCDTHVVTG